MHSFTDTKNRAWNLAVTYASVRRVRELVGVDLLKLDDKLFEQLGDPIKLVDVLYVLCKPQAEALKVTDEEFGESLAGDVLETASDALMGAVGDFFPSRRKALLEKLAGTAKRISSLQMDKFEAVLANPDLEQLLTQLAPPQPQPPPPNPSTASSVNSPDSSASIPVPGASAS